MIRGKRRDDRQSGCAEKRPCSTISLKEGQWLLVSDLEQDIEEEKQPEKRKRAKPAAEIENAYRIGSGQVGTVFDQDASDKETAQDKKKFDPVKAAVAEQAEPGRHLSIKNHESVRENDAQNRQRAEAIEPEDS